MGHSYNGEIGVISDSTKKVHIIRTLGQRWLHFIGYSLGRRHIPDIQPPPDQLKYMERSVL